MKKKERKKREKGKGKERGNVRPLFCQTHACYHGFVLGRACSMVMMAKGAGSNICSQPCPKFRNWKVQRVT